MSGFGEKKENKIKVTINTNEVDKLMKKYKKIKRYMKSPLYDVMCMDGTEKVVSELLEEYHEELDEYYERNPELLKEEEKQEEHYAQGKIDYQNGLENYLNKTNRGQQYDNLF